MNLAEFSKAIDAEKENAVKQFVELHKAIATKAFQLIAQDSRNAGFKSGSPVWSGYYRSNHNISVGQPDTSVSDRPKDLPRWPETPDSILNAPPVSEAAIALSSLQPFGVVYITNAVPYARRLEQGYSPKAPEGIYEPTAIAVREIFKNAKITGIDSSIRIGAR